MMSLSPSITLFPRLTTEVAEWLRASSCRRVYDYSEEIDMPRREEGGICVVREGRVRLILAARTNWELTLAFREPGEAFELHWVDGPVEGELYARAAADRTIIESMPWAALVRAAGPSQIARLDRELYRSWRRQRLLIATIADVIREWRGELRS